MQKIGASIRRWLANKWTQLHSCCEHVRSLENAFPAYQDRFARPRGRQSGLRLETLEDRRMLDGAAAVAVVPPPDLGPAAVGVIDPGVATSGPVANDDAYLVQENQTLTVSAKQAPYGLLINDLPGPDGTLQVVSNTAASDGTVIVAPDGSFTYTPSPGFVGMDSFTYTVSADPTVPAATVYLSVYAPPTTAPTAVDEAYSINVGTVLTANVLDVVAAPDNAPLSAQLVQGPEHGQLNLNPDGSFTYTSLDGYLGADAFTYQALNSFGLSNTATVSIMVQPPEPVVNFPYFTVAQGQTLDFTASDLLAGDSDPRNLPLQVSLFTQPANGTLVEEAGGAFHYQPAADFVGWDSFSFTVTDGSSPPQTTTATIQVGGPLAITGTGDPGDPADGGFGGASGGAEGLSTGATPGTVESMPEATLVASTPGRPQPSLQEVIINPNVPAANPAAFPLTPLALDVRVPSWTQTSQYVAPTTPAIPFHWLFVYEPDAANTLPANVAAHYTSTPNDANSDPEVVPATNREEGKAEPDDMPPPFSLEMDSSEDVKSWLRFGNSVDNQLGDCAAESLIQDTRRSELLRALSQVHQEANSSDAHAATAAVPVVAVMLPPGDGDD
jgi:hypothetical protein